MRIHTTEQELLTEEIAELRTVLRDPASKERYAALGEAVRDGEVPPELLGHLGSLLELGLQSGRLRARYGADGETALARIYGRTPQGTALQEEARNVSEALNGLEAQTIDTIRVAALGPGSYGLTIDTDRCQISVRLDRGGVRIESVALGV